MSLSEKIAIVTGAGRGIGRATAIELAKAGVKVVLAGLTPANLEKVKAEIEALGGEAFSIPIDVSDVTVGERLANAVLEKYGRIDILVNNAGIAPVFDDVYGGWPDSTGCDVELWDKCLNTNARGPFFLTKSILPHMAEQNFGRVVFVSSVCGFHGMTASPPYNASKAALIVLTKSFAREYGKHNVTVNCVAPGYVDTDMNAHQPQELCEAWTGAAAMGRPAHDHDIARAILPFLEEDIFTTGQTLVCDGGTLMN